MNATPPNAKPFRRRQSRLRLRWATTFRGRCRRRPQAPPTPTPACGDRGALDRLEDGDRRGERGADGAHADRLRRHQPAEEPEPARAHAPGARAAAASARDAARTARAAAREARRQPAAARLACRRRARDRRPDGRACSARPNPTAPTAGPPTPEPRRRDDQDDRHRRLGVRRGARRDLRARPLENGRRRSRSRAAARGKARPGLEYKKPAPITVPMISDGRLRGYVVAKVVFTGDAKALHALSDRSPAVRARRGVPAHLHRRQDRVRPHVEIQPRRHHQGDQDDVNTRLGLDLIKDVLIDELNYVDKETLKQRATNKEDG